MQVFDAPDGSVSCARRESSTHAPQALEMLNGDLANRSADALANVWRRKPGPDLRKQIDLGYQLVAGRPAQTEGDRDGDGVSEDGAEARIRLDAVESQLVSCM